MTQERKIAICIAVAKSVPRAPLSGALIAARDFAEWADAQGYKPTLITDEDGEVTLGSLRCGIEKALRPEPPPAPLQPIHRIIVYFAGHGLIRELEEGLWLLSDWERELRAVAIEVLRRRLSMYGPKQICIISDACRSLPAEIRQADLVPDAVLGAGPGPLSVSVEIDKFLATQDGRAAYIIPGQLAEEDRCLFSGVLMDGLWGRQGLITSPFSRSDANLVTSRSLGAYLKAEVPARAKLYALQLNPIVLPSFGEDDDIYYVRGAQQNVAPPRGWPEATHRAGAMLPGGTLYDLMEHLKLAHPGALGKAGSALGGMAAAVGASDGSSDRREHSVVQNSSHQSVFGPASSPAEMADTSLDGLQLANRLQAITWPTGEQPQRTGLADLGFRRLQFWTARGVPAWQAPEGPLWLDLAAAWAPTLIQCDNGNIASLTIFKGLVASALFDEFGATAIIYRQLDSPDRFVECTARALSMLEGNKLNATDASRLAIEMREGKHVDPVLGVLSAYLYNAIGDIDNIIRMCHFYAENGDPIPYDLALLGGLKGVREPFGYKVELPAIDARAPRDEVEKNSPWSYCEMKARGGAEVAGFWPMLRQGWFFLDDPSDYNSQIIPLDLIPFRDGLMRSRFTTFDFATGLSVAKQYGLEPRPG